MPYFDYLLSCFENGHESLEKSFGHHVHWGYWEEPDQAELSLADFALATENLTQLIYGSARVADGQVILDVGCGFGGTISSLNNHYRDVELIGVNIDERQILRARQRVAPVGGNSVRFQQGDACALPFADNSFDAILAVECIFHFPSREQFFKEAYRTLKPGGYLALSDFLLSKELYGIHDLSISQFLTNGFFGSCNVQFTKDEYQQLSRQNNFSIEFEKNITKNTLPTYKFLKSLNNASQLYKLYHFKNLGITLTIFLIELLSKFDLLEYFVFSFRKPLNNS